MLLPDEVQETARESLSVLMALRNSHGKRAHTPPKGIRY